MLFDSYHCFTPQDFVFKIAQTQLELEGYWALRRAIFCQEQGIFHESDQDTVDERAIPIVCASLVAGMEDLVVGVVRIDEREPGLWYGSRLGVAEEFRSIKKLSPGVAVRNHQPVYRGLGALGAGLIYKAVSTAHALGCREFLATVQHQNARFFQRLHWEPMGELELFGLAHVKMRADLNYYLPAANPAIVSTSTRSRRQHSGRRRLRCDSRRRRLSPVCGGRNARVFRGERSMVRRLFRGDG